MIPSTEKVGISVGDGAGGLVAPALVDRTSTSTALALISLSCSRRTTWGARAPWTRTARSRGRLAAASPRSRGGGGKHGRDQPAERHVELARSSIDLSYTNTSDSIPIAMNAAFIPTTPPTMITTVARADPGTPAQQDAAPADGFSSKNAPAWVAILPGDLAHRRQQRQPPARILDGLVGDADRAALLQRLRQIGIGRQVQVGEQDLVGRSTLPSGACGSFTFRTMSASSKTAAVSRTPWPPATRSPRPR